MIRKLVLCVLILLTVGLHVAQAQVTIGSNKEPESFSLLEIDSSDRGLRHPQMTTSERNTFTKNFITDVNKENEARGLVIYNTSIGCLEYYKNKEEGWLSLCNDVVIEQIPLDNATNPAKIRPYSSTDPVISDGTYGKRKYDVAQSSLNSSVDGSCGLIGAAYGRPGDFNTTNDYRRYYALEFNASEDMTKITDIIIGIRQYETKIVTVSGDKPGGGASPNTFDRVNAIIVDFNSTGANEINTIASGRKEANAFYTTIYALFKRDGVLKRVEYTFLVMDCLGCGVRSQSGDEWLRVSCYNQGVVQNASTPSPFTYNALLNGDLYQWGRATDGHEKADSPIFTPYPAIGEITYPTASLDVLNANGQPQDDSPFNFRVGKFIPVTTASQALFFGDWSVQHNAKLWGNGTSNPQMAKSVNDPCPNGFRLPTEQEMTIIMDALVVDNSKSGAVSKAGDEWTTLFLPYTTFRDVEGTLSTGSATTKAQYWTSTVSSTSAQDATVRGLNMTSSAMSIGSMDRALGNAVRCVAE
jgi:uncharacterized protein (TIGR02145 family)